MRNKIKYVFIAIIVLFFASCDEVLTRFELEDADFELASVEPRMGLYGYPCLNDSTLQIDLFKLVDPDTYIFDSLVTINNAIIKVFENGNEIAELSPTSISQNNSEVFPNYRNSSIFLSSDKEYTIEVNAEGFPGISGKTTIPEPVKIDSVVAREGSEDNEDGYTFRLYFTDPVQENYYMVAVNHKIYTVRKIWHDDNTTYHLDTISKTKYTAFPLGDHVFDLLPNQMTSMTEPYDISINKPRIFTDEAFSGKQYGLRFFFPYGEKPGALDDYGQTHSTVYLYSISKELFDGLKSHYQYLTIQGDIYAEPITLYNNITNGFGLWGGMSLDSINVPVLIDGGSLTSVQS